MFESGAQKTIMRLAKYQKKVKKLHFGLRFIHKNNLIILLRQTVSSGNGDGYSAPIEHSFSSDATEIKIKYDFTARKSFFALKLYFESLMGCRDAK